MCLLTHPIPRVSVTGFGGDGILNDTADVFDVEVVVLQCTLFLFDDLAVVVDVLLDVTVLRLDVVESLCHRRKFLSLLFHFLRGPLPPTSVRSRTHSHSRVSCSPLPSSHLLDRHSPGFSTNPLSTGAPQCSESRRKLKFSLFVVYFSFRETEGWRVFSFGVFQTQRKI